MQQDTSKEPMDRTEEETRPRYRRAVGGALRYGEPAELPGLTEASRRTPEERHGRERAPEASDRVLSCAHREEIADRARAHGGDCATEALLPPEVLPEEGAVPEAPAPLPENG